MIADMAEPGKPNLDPAARGKLSYHEDGVGPLAHRHGNVWRREPAGDGFRLVIGPKTGFLELLLQLASCVEEPYALVYVLSVPRIHPAGRYRLDEWLDLEGLRSKLEPYAPYLEGDARHHLWIHSHDSKATLIYDKHDQIFAYGPLDCYENVLSSLGLKEGDFELPFPHYHNYFPEFDTFEDRLIIENSWTRTGILPGVDD